MRARVGVVAAVAVALAVTACAPEEITPASVTFTPDPVVTREPAAEPPEDPIPAVVWPLSGMDATEADPALLARPSLAIKIPNDSKSRPQKNLEHADIVFEQYVEAGIPRLVAIFHSSQPDEVGPVRSMREMDPNIVGSFQGPLVFSGANWNVMSSARNTGQLLIAQDLGDGGFFRTKDRYSPYNLYVDVADILAQAGDSPQPPQQFNYAYPSELATAFVEGTPASHIDLRLSRYGEPGWDWQADTGVWTRTEFGEPDITVDGNHISATNVVVLFVRVYYHWGLPVSEMIVSNRAGYVATGGKYLPIKWSKADRTGKYVLTTEDGEPVSLAAGQTWVELIPNEGVAGGHAKFS
ncbi:DUF3048 domain-containing protein [Demequina sp.]|uniref:DUF3048 domain-containing protein n=1 Tax=Demequina sp. TaxID=2050685 RepID=UPI0025BD921D|nr:DUF3048 domain-containing protein [Demequina sp.]